MTLLGGAAAPWPFAVRAQQSALPVIGFVNSASPGSYPPLSSFQNGLSETGFVEGRNVAIEYRWAEGHYDRLPALITDLVQHKTTVIATCRWEQITKVELIINLKTAKAFGLSTPLSLLGRADAVIE